ncbi:MAG TPA: DedA family protein [Alphaproteobacteria bacterium]
MDFSQIVAEYGAYVYPLIFAWAFVEGETFVIFAGVAAHQGYLDWTLMFLLAWLGSFSGDQLYFWIGRHWGKDLLCRFPRWRPTADTALTLLHRYNTWFILSFRFIYGVRNLASFAIGMSGVRPLRFMALNLIAAGVWAFSFAGFGYVFGEVLEAVLGDIARTFGLVMLGVFVFVSILLFFIHRRQQRRLVHQAAPAPSRLATSDSSVPRG